jgi:RimJ/RimL family protein N-acetyltransferase
VSSKPAPTPADHEVVLSDDAILLRAFRLDDAEAIYAAVVESKAELSRWLPWCHDKYAINDTIEFLKSRGAAFADDGEYGFAIIERDGGRFVGATGINQVDRSALRANHGYWLRTSATGRGYAARSSLLVARWAFEALGLERLEIVAAVGNLASQRVAERIGATREGVARRRMRVRDVQHDAVIFSLVRGDLLHDNGC